MNLVWCTELLKKAGYSGSWAILLIVPYINIVFIWLFPFLRWPSLAVREAGNATFRQGLDKGISAVRRSSGAARNYWNNKRFDLDEYEDKYFRVAALELQANRAKPDVWAKASVLAEGDSEKTKSHYIKLRVKQLSASEEKA